MISGKATLQVFLPTLFNYSYILSQQTTRKVAPGFSQINKHTGNSFTAIGLPEISSQMFNSERTVLSIIKQLIPKSPVNHYSNTIWTSNYSTIKTLQV